MSEPILSQAHNIYEQQAHNRRMTWFIMSGIIILFGILGFGIDYFYLGVFESRMEIPPVSTIAVIMSFAFALGCLNGGSSLVLKTAQAIEANPENTQHRQILNIIQEMSLASGLPVPKVYIIPDDDPNAFATGKDPGSSTIAVTRGLLTILDRDELQGVIAHEMSHIRYYDIRLMTTVAAFVGIIVLFSDLMMRGLRFGVASRSRRSRSGGPLVALLFVLWIITIFFAPLLTRVMAMMISRKREYLADASGAELTRNPLALASALTKLENASAPTKTIKRGIAHLCIVDPMGKPVNEREGFWADLFATHPPIQKRIMLLKSMAYQRIE
jgi:heat shock protein HtpX